MSFTIKTIKKSLWQETVWEIYISKTVQITNVNIINRETIAYLLPETKTNYYVNLNEKNLTDNKQFWWIVKPLLSDKIKSSKKINRTERNSWYGW